MPTLVEKSCKDCYYTRPVSSECSRCNIVKDVLNPSMWTPKRNVCVQATYICRGCGEKTVIAQTGLFLKAPKPCKCGQSRYSFVAAESTFVLMKKEDFWHRVNETSGTKKRFKCDNLLCRRVFARAIYVMFQCSGKVVKVCPECKHRQFHKIASVEGRV